MKQIIIALTLTLLSTTVYSATKCEASPKGVCCWDTVVDGPFKPFSCY